jgi:gelsolin
VFNIYFWLGAGSSQDEKGVAAFKTVELDDVLGCGARQNREVEGYESAAFLALFPNMQVLAGGVDSGFNKLRPAEYTPRLLRVHGVGSNVRQTELPRKRSSLNSSDVFILDNGMTIFQWNGSSSRVAARVAAAAARRLRQQQCRHPATTSTRNTAPLHALPHSQPNFSLTQPPPPCCRQELHGL